MREGARAREGGDGDVDEAGAGEPGVAVHCEGIPGLDEEGREEFGETLVDGKTAGGIDDPVWHADQG